LKDNAKSVGFNSPQLAALKKDKNTYFDIPPLAAG